MAGYLLSTQALKALCEGKNTSATAFLSWLNSLTPADQLFASEVSLGELRSAAEQLPDPRRREAWRHYVDKAIAAHFGPNLLPLTSAAIREWGLIRLIGQPPLPAEETLIIGQAIAYSLTYVGPETASHLLIGCTILDPYKSAGWPP